MILKQSGVANYANMPMLLSFKNDNFYMKKKTTFYFAKTYIMGTRENNEAFFKSTHDLLIMIFQSKT